MGIWEKEDLNPHRCNGQDGVVCFGIKGAGLSLSFPVFVFNDEDGDDHPDISIHIKYCPFCGFHYE